MLETSTTPVPVGARVILLLPAAAVIAKLPELPVILVAIAAPIVGVTSVGLVANTKEPLPVSSVTAAAICALVATSVLLPRLIVLFVSVCVPVRVATVLSISIVTVLLVTVEVRPTPPTKVSVSVSKDTASVPVSPAIFKFVAIDAVEALVN